MSTNALAEPPAASSVEAALPRAAAADWLELAKPRISTLVVITTLAGFLLADTSFDALRLLSTLVGTGLLAAGASVLNQILERDHDALMERTAHRPVPTGRIHPDHALAYAVGLVVVGLAVLLLLVNALTAGLGAFTVAGYAFVYTPMKRWTSLSTIVGAVPGALPPMMGWAAARDAIEAPAWALFGLLFVWQLPHFLAIAWMCRDDYARAGFPMLTVADTSGRRTGTQAVLWCLAILPVSLLPTVLGVAGEVYFAAALLLGLGYLAASWAFSRDRSLRAARRLLLTSVVYLPVILLSLVLDRLIG